MYKPNNYWLGRVKEIAKVTAERWNGLVQVGMTDMGGIFDIFSSFRPGEKLLCILYDYPQDVKRLIWVLHDLWLEYYREIDDIFRLSSPGYSAWTGILAGIIEAARSAGMAVCGIGPPDRSVGEIRYFQNLEQIPFDKLLRTMEHPE